MLAHAGAAVPTTSSSSQQQAGGARDEMYDTAMLDDQETPVEGRAFVCATAAFMRSRQTFGSGAAAGQNALPCCPHVSFAVPA